jgi:hypothetical protein
MNEAMLEWLPAVLAAAAFLVALLALLGVRINEHGARRNSPFADDFTRAPGHSLRRSTESAYRKLWRAILAATIWPLLVYAAWTSLYLLAGTPRSPMMDLAFSAVLLVGFAWALVRLMRAQQRFASLRLSLDGEIAAGQMLAGVVGQGARLVHDVSFPGGRFAHALVTPSGVCAIHTVARRGRGRGRQAVTVHVEGDDLRFPGASDPDTIPHVRAQAVLLADHLHQAAGRIVTVRPVVAMPGWLVDRQLSTDVAVLNPREAARLLTGPTLLHAATIDEIAGVLEAMGPRSQRAAAARDPLLERKEPRL